jgi:hypothetical protein
MDNIVKMLDLSTGHVSEATATLLNKWSSDADGSPVVAYEKGVYGWLVSTAVIGAATPDDLKACIDYALDRDCEWIMFDCDSDTVDALPTYDW